MVELYAGSPENNRIVKIQNDWLNSNDPWVVVSGDNIVSRRQLDIVKTTLDSLVDFLKLNISVDTDYNAGLENKDLIDIAYDSLQKPYGSCFDDNLQIASTALIKLQNNYNGYRPHLDIIITNENMSSCGSTHSGTIFLNGRYVNPSERGMRLIEHEFYHSLGVAPNLDGYGNCNDSNCIMTLNLSGSDLCDCCNYELNEALINKMQNTGKYFIR